MKRIYSFVVLPVLLFSFLLNPVIGAEKQSVSEKARENYIITAATGSHSADDVDKDLLSLQIVNMISNGDFDLAKQTLGRHKNDDPKIQKLKSILGRYEKIEAKRREKRIEVYNEQLEELDKLAKIADSNGLDDANDVAAILSAAIKARDYADKDHKDDVLKKDIVNKAVEKSLENAKEYEAKGEWLEALLASYSFLTSLDDSNKQWESHREELTDKAVIKASLMDTPCETSEERHKGIKPEMFKRAVMALDYRYVTVINYTDLALAALERSSNLADVLAKMEPEDSITFSTEANALSAWKSGIEDLIVEVKKPITGISRDKFLDIYEQTLELNKKSLDVTEEVLIAQFAEAALGELDPHTNLVWPWYVTDFMKNMSGEFSGVGIEISKSEGLLKVSSLLPETPAYNSGIDAGDLIVNVDGESTKEMTLECAVRKITGPEGTDVVLTVRHPQDDETRDITITRAKIKVPTVRSWRRGDEGDWLNMIDPDDKIGYVKITSFTSEQTSEELERQLEQLESNGMQALILDLRFNSGGYLSQAVEIVDKFIKDGLIVSTRPRLGSFPQWEVATGEMHPKYPLVILINGQSASASEIVAGALQDKAYERAILVGERTYGKGSVQTIIPYPGDNAQLKYTMAYYHLPSGQRVKNRYERERMDKTDWGIAPDVEVELRSDEIRELYDVQRDNAVLAQKDHDENGEPIKRYTVEETIEADPQLAVAILVAKAQLVKEQIDDAKIAKIDSKVSK